MEEARHWVWAKRKHGLISTSEDHLHVSKKASSCDDSWEEQAFAEDASGSLGGCIWPPRSYSCSFCGREFRSAQALGGHMNVHRRDRARLKQSPPDLHREILHQSHHHNNNLPVKNINPLITSFGSPQYPSQVCALVYNPNPNSNHGDPANFIESPPPCQKSFHEKQILFPHYYSSSSSLLQENNNKKRSSTSLISPPSSQIWSNLATDRYNHSSNQKNHIVEKQISSITDHVESAESCRNKGDYHVKTHDLSVSLNLVLCHSCPTMSDGKEEIITPETTCKRRRANYTEPSLPPSPRLKPCSVDSHDHVSHQSEAFELSPCSIEDLDLELRLGGQPYKVLNK